MYQSPICADGHFALRCHDMEFLMNTELHLEPELRGWHLHSGMGRGIIFATYELAAAAALAWGQEGIGRHLLVDCDMGTTTRIDYLFLG
jgi:hypothetical protein